MEEYEEFSDTSSEEEFQIPGSDVSTSLLEHAVGVDDVDTCRQLVNHGADLDATCEEFGATLMHYAALNEAHGVEMIEFLYSLGLRVDVKNNFGNTPIHYAVDAGNFPTAKELLHRYNEKERQSFGNLLHFFVAFNNLELAKLALKHDPQMLFDFNEKGYNAFLLAAECADLHMCKWLLSKGANPRVLTKDKWAASALHIAGLNKSHGEHLVRFFVSSIKFDVNAKDKLDLTPLHYALEFGNLAVAKNLLDLGANLIVNQALFHVENLMHFCVRQNKLNSVKFVHERNKNLIKEFTKDGKNCLHVAAGSADLEMCEWLLSEGVDPRAVTMNVWEGTALQFVGFNQFHCKDLVRFFVSSLKFDVDEKDSLCFTPLFGALELENLVAANELLSLGADLTVKRAAYHMENLIHYCARRNKINSAKFVHERNKALVKEVREDGKYCFHVAAEHAGIEMCKWLISEGADPLAVTNDELEDTALHLAGLNKAHGKELVRFFVSSLKLDVNAKDKYDLCALHYALENENLDAAEELVSLGADLTVKRAAFNMENLMHFCVCLNKRNSAKFVHQRNKNLIKEFRKDGKSCFHLAANSADLEMCKWLLNEGVDPREVTKDEYENTALQFAASNEIHGKELVFYFVSSLKFDVNLKNNLGSTPLHYALSVENLDAATVLLSHGADLAAKRTACNMQNLMHLCVQANHINSAKFVHEKNKELVMESTLDGRNCLHIAAKYADLKMCVWLVDECGVDPRTLCTGWKTSVIHFAAFNLLHGQEIISFFLSNYALDVNAKDSWGCTPLKYAFKKENVNAKQVLFQMGAH